MMWHPVLRSRGLTSSAAILMLLSSRLPAEEVNAKSKPIFVTSGQEITPTAAPGSLLQYLKPGLADFPNYLASGGTTTARTPDGNTPFVLPARYNTFGGSARNFFTGASPQDTFV